MDITDLTFKMLEAHRSMKALHGDQWEHLVTIYGEGIRKVEESRRVPIMTASLMLAEKAADDDQHMVSVMFIAVGAELAMRESKRERENERRNRNSRPDGLR